MTDLINFGDMISLEIGEIEREFFHGLAIKDVRARLKNHPLKLEHENENGTLLMMSKLGSKDYDSIAIQLVHPMIADNGKRIGKTDIKVYFEIYISHEHRVNFLEKDNKEWGVKLLKFLIYTLNEIKKENYVIDLTDDDGKAITIITQKFNKMGQKIINALN